MDAFMGFSSLILGTIIFIGINCVLDIWYIGKGAIFGEWFVCCGVAYFIINSLGVAIGGVFSLIWFLLKACIKIGIICVIGNCIYKKFKGSSE